MIGVNAGKFLIAVGIACFLVFGVANIWLSSAVAGTKTYDIDVLLGEPHPFNNRAAINPVVWPATPVPADQLRQRATMPQPSPWGLPPVRYASSPSARDRVPTATVQQMELPPKQKRPGLWGFISEVRLGVVAHDIGPFSSNEEDIIADYNGEILFNSPGFLDIVWAPRPHLGFTLNTGGDTSQVYAGLTWEYEFWRSWFIDFSLGGSLHNGKKQTTQINRKELGCHLLFRESFEIGYRFPGGHSVTGFLDHISNANICDANEGLESAGIRYGYRF
jgi:lipid A 3-O-deacylase